MITFFSSQCSCSRFICNQRDWYIVGLLLEWWYRMWRILHNFIHTMHLLVFYICKYYHFILLTLLIVKLWKFTEYLGFIFIFLDFKKLYDHLIKYHHEKLRMNGYHEFYRTTALHKGIPLYTVSLWNTVILGIQTIMQHQYGPKFFDHCSRHSLFSPTAYIVMFSVLESIILIGIHSWYIARVMSFNRATLPPDAYRGLSESLSSVNKNIQWIYSFEKFSK